MGLHSLIHKVNQTLPFYKDKVDGQVQSAQQAALQALAAQQALLPHGISFSQQPQTKLFDPLGLPAQASASGPFDPMGLTSGQMPAQPPTMPAFRSGPIAPTVGNAPLTNFFANRGMSPYMNQNPYSQSGNNQPGLLTWNK